MFFAPTCFGPIAEGRYPVILSYGPYAKGLAFQDGYPSAWQRMAEKHPDVAAGSSNLYQSWEVVDPEKWVPHDYACVRVDSRGAGCSPGFIDQFAPRETKDYYDCIEWAGSQPWSNGKVGLNGISYYGINQWHVASREPPHLSAMCIWEGAADWYRDMTHHGGILSTFWENWYDMQVKTVQYGAGERGKRSRVHGELVCGPDVLSDEELAKNRSNFGADIAAHPLDDDYHHARSPVWSKVKVPFLSAANWGGQGLHTRGNFEGFVRAASKQKWLEVHGIEHWTHFYTDYGRNLQLRFFDYFLHGKKNGWDKQPPVQLQIRHVDRFVERGEKEWPLKRTKWTKFYLDPANGSLGGKAAKKKSALRFDAMGDGVTFLMPPLAHETEITGPSAVKLFVSSSTNDADIFVVLRVFSPDFKEVVFQGAIDPHTPVGQGWLRASHRRSTRNCQSPTGPTTRIRRSSRSSRAKLSRSISRSGRPRLSCRPATALRSLSAARITFIPGRAADGCRTSRTSSPAAVRSCTTTRAIARRRFSAALPVCISAARRGPICCCPSFRRRGNNRIS